MAVPGVPSYLVDDIHVRNWVKISADEYYGELHVILSASTYAPTSLRVLGINFKTDPTSPENAKKIISCGVSDQTLEAEGPPAGPPLTYDPNYQQYCSMMGGSFDTGTNSCDITQRICAAMNVAYDPVTKKCTAGPAAAAAPIATQTFMLPRKNGLPVATFGGHGWTTWHTWCQEQGFIKALSPIMGATAKPCCGNANRTGVFTTWQCNYWCNHASLQSLTCSN